MTAVNENVEKHYLSWNDLENCISEMIHDLSYDSNGMEKKLPTGVYGLPRGGLVIATILSNRLNIPMLMAPCDGCIVVDDLSDSGVTLKHYRDCGYTIFTWGAKPQTSVQPDWFYEMWGQNEWIVFPWESK